MSCLYAIRGEVLLRTRSWSRSPMKSPSITEWIYDFEVPESRRDVSEHVFPMSAAMKRKRYGRKTYLTVVYCS